MLAKRTYVKNSFRCADSTSLGIDVWTVRFVHLLGIRWLSGPIGQGAQLRFIEGMVHPSQSNPWLQPDAQ